MVSSSDNNCEESENKDSESDKSVRTSSTVPSLVKYKRVNNEYFKLNISLPEKKIPVDVLYENKDYPFTERPIDIYTKLQLMELSECYTPIPSPGLSYTPSPLLSDEDAAKLISRILIKSLSPASDKKK